MRVVGDVRHLYVHVPFCAHRCGYCDFVTVTGPRAAARAVRRRAAGRARSWSGGVLADDVETVFLGGGTPSLLGPELLGRLLDAPAAGERRAHRGGQPGDRRRRARRGARGARLPRLAGRAGLGAASSRCSSAAPRPRPCARAVATLRGGRRREPLARPDLRRPRRDAARARPRPRRRCSRSSRSTSPATSSRPSPARASRTATGAELARAGRAAGGPLRARHRRGSRRPATAGTRRRASAATGPRGRHNSAYWTGARLPRHRRRRGLHRRRRAPHATRPRLAPYLGGRARAARPAARRRSR